MTQVISTKTLLLKTSCILFMLNWSGCGNKPTYPQEISVVVSGDSLVYSVDLMNPLPQPQELILAYSGPRRVPQPTIKYELSLSDDWIHISKTSGTIGPDTPDTILVTVSDYDQMVMGEYKGTIIVLGTAEGMPGASVEVNLILIGLAGGWTEQESGTMNHLSDICFVDSLDGWAVGGRGTVIKTFDGGNSWALQSSGTGYSLNCMQFLDDISGVVGGESGWLAFTEDGGTNWTKRTTDLLWINDLYFLENQRGFIVGARIREDSMSLEFTILKTMDAGENWTEVYSTTPDYTWWDYLSSICFTDAGLGYVVGVVGQQGTIVRSSDTGNTWSLLEGITYVSLNAVTFVGSQKGWAVGSGGTVLHTADGGNTWSQQPSGVSNDLKDVEFVDESHGWAVGSRGTIISTSNGGQTWELQSLGLSRWFTAVDFVDTSLGWVVGNDGKVFHTSTGGW